MAHDLSLNLIVPTAAISMPEDGDDLDAAVMEAVIQNLGDRSAATIAAIYSHIAWAETLAVAPGGSLTSFSIEVGAIHRLFGLTATDTIRVGAAGTTTIGVSKVEGTPGTLGASARWWYVYAWMNGGSVDYAISLTGPDATGRVKSADASRVYLGCFPTDTTGAPIPLRKTGNRVLYRRSGVAVVLNPLASNGLRVLDRNAVQSSFTAIDLRPVVPPHSRAALLRLTAIGDAGPDNATLALYTGTDNTTASPAAEAYTIDNHEVRLDVEVEIAQAAQSVTYKLTNGAAGAINGYVDALGFLE